MLNLEFGLFHRKLQMEVKKWILKSILVLVHTWVHSVIFWKKQVWQYKFNYLKRAELCQMCQIFLQLNNLSLIWSASSSMQL